MTEALTSPAEGREGQGQGGLSGDPSPASGQMDQGCSGRVWTCRFCGPVGPQAVSLPWLRPPGLSLLLGMQTTESEAPGAARARSGRAGRGPGGQALF